jgi:hypothetical protein
MACSTQELSDKIAKLERNVTDLRSYQAEQTDTINAMDSQLKIVSGRLEEIEFSQNKRLGRISMTNGRSSTSLMR